MSEQVTILESLLAGISNFLLGERLPIDIYDNVTGEILVPASKKITKRLVLKLFKRVATIDCDPSPFRSRLREIIEAHEHLSELQPILESMQVPTLRRTDVPWLVRNLQIENAQHPRLAEAMDLVRRIVRKQYRPL
jgi:hypothetical protein